MSHDFGSPSGGAPSGAPGYGAPQQPYGQHQGAPSYGYASPGYGAPQGPPPKTKVKPSIGWIVGAWLVFVLSVIVGIAGFAGGIFSAITDAAPTSSFEPGKAVTVKLDPADKPAIYVSAETGTNFECQIQGDPEKVRLQQPGVQQTVTSDGVVWELALRIGVDKAGDYQLTCTTSEGAPAKFGVGKEIVADSVVGGAIALFAVPGLGFLLAVIVTIVVLVRRSGARRRQAAAAAGQWGQPGAYGR
ncbi:MULTISPECIES: hypothetical protein [Streptosporangium]|uniref:Serine/arginine repetitive matrix protein 2 n=1 Tax=Streptosporangium brasiliense TaxID=47480 RepID=A0ABT9QWJ8_9ACTN|nr:hypothetical protein [Streptosporangium brasiliense]MDP9861356.1 hypothetical protein [Streptosporangium brasiliense]